MDTLKVQSQIRNNADEISNYLNDLMKWESKIQHTDQAIRERKQSKINKSVRSSAGVVHVAAKSLGSNSGNSPSKTSASAPAQKEASAAKHTYDVGYKKWDKINVDDLLADSNEVPVAVEPPASVQTRVSDASMLTPASIVPHIPCATATVPAPRGSRSTGDMETFERQRGNEEFEKGNFHQAVKHYTTCLGLKVGNFVAFSNRAMAYLRMKEYSKAEMDCNSALRIEPTHVKSYLRRATARNALGKHRAATADLQQVLHMEPSNKTANQELKKSLDMLRTAASKAPMVSLSPLWIGDADDDVGAAVAGPELPTHKETHVTDRIEEVNAQESSAVTERPRRVSFDDTATIIENPIAEGSKSPRPASAAAVVKPADISPTTVKKAQKKLKSDSSKKKAKTKPAAPAIGWYQVERNLVSYRAQPIMLTSFIESLAVDSLVTLPCWETGVVVELLQVVCDHYRDVSIDAVRLWLDLMQTLPNFSLLHTLWTHDEKAKLRDLFASLESSIGVEASKQYEAVYSVVSNT